MTGSLTVKTLLEGKTLKIELGESWPWNPDVCNSNLSEMQSFVSLYDLWGVWNLKKCLDFRHHTKKCLKSKKYPISHTFWPKNDYEYWTVWKPNNWVLEIRDDSLMVESSSKPIERFTQNINTK